MIIVMALLVTYICIQGHWRMLYGTCLSMYLGISERFAVIGKRSWEEFFFGSRVCHRVGLGWGGCRCQKCFSVYTVRTVPCMILT